MLLDVICTVWQFFTGIWKLKAKGGLGRYSKYTTKQLPNHCGACSVMNAVKAYGIGIGQRQVAKLAERPYKIWLEGLDSPDLKRALRKLNCDAKEINTKVWKEFVKEVDEHLKNGDPVILCIEDYAHWVTIVEKRNGKYIIADSYDYSHVINRWSRSTLREYVETTRNNHYAMLISKKAA